MDTPDVPAQSRDDYAAFHLHLPANPNQPTTIATPRNTELLITIITPETIPQGHLPARSWSHHGIYLHTRRIDSDQPPTHEITLGHTHNLYLHTKRTLATNPTQAPTWERTLFITYTTPDPDDTERAALHARSNPHDEYTTLARVLHTYLTQHYTPNLHLPYDASILRSTQAELFPLDDTLNQKLHTPQDANADLITIIRILHHLNTLPAPTSVHTTSEPEPAPQPEHTAPEPASHNLTTPRPITSAQQRQHSPTTIKDLILSGYIKPHTTIHPTYINTGDEDINALILPNGDILYHGISYPTPSAAAIAARGIPHINGWEYWGTLTPTQLAGPHSTTINTITPLTALRDQHDITLLDNALTLFGVPREP